MTVVDIPNPRYDILIAGGVDTDISFDGSVSSVPEHNNNITFVHKFII